MNRFNEIKSLQGRVGIGARLTGGRKNEKGQIDFKSKGMLWITEPFEKEITGPNGKKIKQLPLHDKYAFFNNAKPERRREIRIRLESIDISEAYTAQLRCQKGDKTDPRAQGNLPFCTGDSERAKRWNGQEYEEISCADRECKYRQMLPQLCKPDVSILFRPVWSNKDLPTDLMRFDTGSWNTGMNIKGFFDKIRKTAAKLGIEPNVWGLPCKLIMIQKTKAAGQGLPARSFQVVSIQEDDVDIVQHMVNFERNAAELREMSKRIGITATPIRNEIANNDIKALESSEESETRGSIMNPSEVVEGEVVGGEGPDFWS